MVVGVCQDGTSDYGRERHIRRSGPATAKAAPQPCDQPGAEGEHEHRDEHPRAFGSVQGERRACACARAGRFEVAHVVHDEIAAINSPTGIASMNAPTGDPCAARSTSPRRRPIPKKRNTTHLANGPRSVWARTARYKTPARIDAAPIASSHHPERDQVGAAEHRKPKVSRSRQYWRGGRGRRRHRTGPSLSSVSAPRWASE